MGLSKKQRIRKLQVQQRELVTSARGGKKAHRSRIKEQYSKEAKRRKLYRGRKAQKRALQTGRLRKRIPRNGRRKRKLMNQIDSIFR